MPKKNVNILFTSVGRRVELIQAFRRAYQELGISGEIIATDIDTLAPALHIVDRPFIVSRFDAEDFIPQIVDICNKYNVSIVFPLIDPEIPILATHRNEIEANNETRLAIFSFEAVRICSDKLLTMNFFESINVPIPKYWIPDNLSIDEIVYPIFIKPRFGSASRHTFRINNIKELLFFRTYVPNPIIQEFLPGSEVTNDIICDFNGNLLSVVSRQRIEARWGEVAKGVTIYHPEITELCKKIALALNTIGPITIQCIMKDGSPRFTEINPRFGGGLPLGIAAGVDSPKWYLSIAAGMPLSIPPLGTYKEGLYFTRFDESFYLSEKDLRND